ncbi:hypothetical protein [Nocardia transvalensis]|uniref:hypothetical protein n=1 Tax=Nocardia transvalensis TaxID=37333 RepID=UPI001E566FA6|nr:hypothetical protein [Nocardia transvalensis]
MTDSERGAAGHTRDDHFAELAEELRLLAEAVLERVEPVLRRAAADGRTEWDSCSWCPVCAAAALVRGEHHDVAAAVADHGIAIVTVLREALAGVPVEPVVPPDLEQDDSAPHGDSGPASPPGGGTAEAGDPPAGPDGTMGRVSETAPTTSSGTTAAGRHADDRDPGGRPSFGTALFGAVAERLSNASTGRDSRGGTGDSASGVRPRAGRRSGYMPIPVHIKA